MDNLLLATQYYFYIYTTIYSVFSLSSFLLSLSLSTVYGLFVPFKSWLRDLSAMKLKLKFILILLLLFQQ